MSINKARPLRRVVQEQNRFLYNQDLDTPWEMALIRLDHQDGSHFSLGLPEDSADNKVISVRPGHKSRTIHIIEDAIPLFAEKTVQYAGQVACLAIARDSKALQALTQSIKIAYRSDDHEHESDGGLLMTHAQKTISFGTPNAYFDQAYTKVTSRLLIDNYQDPRREPRGALAEWKDNTLTVWCSSAWPHMVKRCVAEATGLAQRHIVIISVPSSYLPDRFLIDSTMYACYVAIGAVSIQGRAKLFLSEAEDRRFASKQSPIDVELQSAHDQDGKMVALRSTVSIDLGRYACASNEIIQHLALGLTSSYQCPNQEHRLLALATASSPSFPNSMLGMTLVQEALEQHVQQICSQLALDPILWRKDNLLQKGQECPYGTSAESFYAAHEVIDSVSKMSDFARKHASCELLRKKQRYSLHAQDAMHNRPRGVGLAIGSQSHGLLSSFELNHRARIDLTMSDDGHLTVQAPFHAHYSGLREPWLACIYQLLGIEERNVSFARFSSEDVEDSGPSRFSRLAALHSPLLAQACINLRHKIRSRVHPFVARASYVNQKRLTWDTAAFRGNPFLGRTWIAAVIELSLDQIDLSVSVDSVCLSVAGGCILNTESARTHIRQSVIACLDWLSSKLAQPNLLSTSTDLYASNLGHGAKRPTIQIQFQQPDTKPELQARFAHAAAIGELAFGAIPAAFHNALVQISGSSFTSSSVDSQQLFQKLYQALDQEPDHAG